ncbi:hypothetical protein PPYR_07629 [Photinus pyralis]|uniref:T-box domain-containing protein n=2 Tax=Photinus pyralis TaxID=7054 RepID=A0A5N4AC96_PHOPY|nr:T-box protein 2-like [Photinus pyralis]KAB0794950.1 hypothetical protein PPYR_11789 [Photinus pyralis]KAB0799749.1 hypothetical protein PPYR_07629 [Photinus pyralis]
MFPYIRVTISGLDPSAYYCVMLQFHLASNHRFKYYSSTGWTLAGSEEKNHSQRVYIHPESPATGAHWMSQTVSFAKAKLSNTMSPPLGLVVLSSMHQYQPTITIVKTVDPRSLPWMSPTTSVAFPETQFIAVTAYQNEQITKLKIEYNPFAKGFRENEEGKSKRKRAVKEEDYDIKREIIDSSSNSSSPSLDMAAESRIIESRLSQFPLNPFHMYYNHYSFAPYNYMYPPFYLPQQFDLHTGNYYESPLVPQVLPKTVSSPASEVPKKLTDFSIRAITGL